MTADIAAKAERLHLDWDEARQWGDAGLLLAHYAQVQADAARAAALKLRADHPDHPDLDWLEGDHQ